MTVRRLDVLRLMAEGLTNREIAEQLIVEEATVRTHVADIMDCLDARNRAHAVAIGLRGGLIGR